jgi:hypothetical protein
LSSRKASQLAPSSGQARLVEQIDEVLRKAKLTAPKWPKGPLDAGDKKITPLWQNFKTYREAARRALIKANLIDDPDKPKKLSEAIDFKGICEEMCPEFEQVERIMEGNISGPEKEDLEEGLGGKPQPVRHKMVKANKRSAAGQEAPLPMDVRSPAALRRTMDYLINEVLGREEGRLERVQIFIWDRTRALRTDFTRQMSSMEQTEWQDYVYCLERIARFHITSLHYMSDSVIDVDDYSEQQDLEQLSKTLVSLKQAYDDCKVRGITCENEKEFRAYYVLFFANIPDILETVQDWGWEFWGESEQIKDAVSLVEILQNIWDVRGPLKPHSATDIAQNAGSRFFSVVENKNISYTMACLAEMHFGLVRKSILKTILSSYRKQRDQTREWTLSELNKYLRFDDEDAIIDFGIDNGVHFGEMNGQMYLSFEGETSVDLPTRDPTKQTYSYSYNLVERKRGNHSLPDVIERPVYDEQIRLEGVEDDNDDGEELFVKDNNFTMGSVPSASQQFPEAFDTDNDTMAKHDSTPLSHQIEPASIPVPTKPKLVFDQGTAAKEGFSPSFFTAYKPNSAEPKAPTVTAEDVGTPQPSSSLLFPSPGIESRGSGFNFSKVEPSPNLTESPTPAVAATDESSLRQHNPISLLQEIQPTQPPPTVFSQPTQPTPSFQFPQPTPKPSITFTQPTSTTAPAQPVRPTIEPDRSRFDNAVSWYVSGPDGLIDQFIECEIEQIVTSEYQKFKIERATELAREEAEAAQKEADDYRRFFLSKKYLGLWRKLSHELWLKKKGRAARRLREEMARSSRAAKAAEDVVEDFRASTTRRRPESVQSLLGATGVLDGVHNLGATIQAIVREDTPKPNPHRRSERTPKKEQTPRKTSQKRDDPLRRSILSDPSYLSGESRILHMPKYSMKDMDRKQVSGVQTDYFRLKARGISTTTKGTPLASSLTRRLHSSQNESSYSPKSRSPVTSHSPLSYSPEQNNRKRSLVDGDDIIAQIKRVKAQLEEGETWYREQNRKLSESRSNGGGSNA